MRVHLDHNAGTPVDPRVLERFVAVERSLPGNPASLHARGRAARAGLESARADLARALGVDPGGVVFVSGGTEANNTAVLGLGDARLPTLLAPVEHPSVTGPARRRGARWWSVDASARARVAAPDEPVGLLCLCQAQSETGSLQPVADAGTLARELGSPLHVDAAQTLGRVPLADALGHADSLSLAPHKAGGLRGCGVLVLREPSRLQPLLLGGGHEHGVRAGTPSAALAAATALAVELAVAEQEARAAAMRAARDAFASELESRVPCRRLTPETALPNTVLYCFDELDGRNLLPALDMAGIEASHGTACSSGAPAAPPVFSAMGLDEDTARLCVRFSTSYRTGVDEAAHAGRTVARVVSDLRRAGRTRDPSGTAVQPPG